MMGEVQVDPHGGLQTRPLMLPGLICGSCLRRWLARDHRLVPDVGGYIDDVRGNEIFRGFVRLEKEFIRTEVYPVPRLQLCAGDSLAVDKETVPTLGVFDGPGFLGLMNDGMVFGHLVIGQLD